MIVAFTHMTIIHVHAAKDDMTYLANSIEELLDEHQGETVGVLGMPVINVVENYLARLESQHLILMGDFGMSPSMIPQLTEDDEETADLYYLKDDNTKREGIAFMGSILNGLNKAPTCCYPVYKKNRRLLYNVDQILTTFPDITVRVAEETTNKDDMSSHLAVGAIIQVGLQARHEGIGLEDAEVRDPDRVKPVIPPPPIIPPPPVIPPRPITPPRPVEPKIKLPDGIYRMDFIRHGLGCRALSNYIADPKFLPPRLLTDALRVKAEGVDPLLADTGLLQALALRSALLGKNYKAVFTSPLRRAIETTLIVFGPRDVAISLIPQELRTPGLIQGISERTAGIPEIFAMPYLSEVRARTLGVRTRVNIDNESIGVAELEAWLGPHKDAIKIVPRATQTEFNIIGFLNELSNMGIKDNESSYAVVTHGNAMRSIYKTFTKEPLEDKRPYPTELWPMLVDIPGRTVLRYYSAPIIPPVEYRLDRKSVTRDRLLRHGSRCRWVKAIKASGGRRTRRLR
jgi:broad specificity phosphatase PhoE